MAGGRGEIKSIVKTGISSGEQEKEKLYQDKEKEKTRGGVQELL